MIVSIMQTELFIPSPQPIKITFELVFSLHPFMITKLLKQLMLIYTIEHSSKVHIASAFLAKLKEDSFLRFVIRDCIKNDTDKNKQYYDQVIEIAKKKPPKSLWICLVFRLTEKEQMYSTSPIYTNFLLIHILQKDHLVP